MSASHSTPMGAGGFEPDFSANKETAGQRCTLQEFYDELDRHDWYYHFSDDHRVWQAGVADSNRLAKLALQSPEHDALMKAFNEWRFSGESFGKPQAPKPERPA